MKINPTWMKIYDCKIYISISGARSGPEYELKGNEQFHCFDSED